MIDVRLICFVENLEVMYGSGLWARAPAHAAQEIRLIKISLTRNVQFLQLQYFTIFEIHQFDDDCFPSLRYNGCPCSDVIDDIIIDIDRCSQLFRTSAIIHKYVNFEEHRAGTLF